MSRATARARLWPVALLAGCTGPQSALDPAGPTAASLHRLGSVMYLVAALVVLLVAGLMLVPFLRRRDAPANRRLFLWGGGVALPLATMSVIVPYVFTVGHDMRADIPVEHLSVDVTGHQFWWEVSYRPAHGDSAISSANELRVPVGEPVELLLRASDVIHSFWIPSFAGKTDMIPGRVNRMVIQADRPGVFRGQCAEYCGRQHALMGFTVVAMPRAAFDRWLAGQAGPAEEPASPELREGRELYVGSGCGACHTIRGVSQGRLGPDLTRVGERLSIAAGTLPNNVGSIAGWIASSQHIKPGNLMPSFDGLQGRQLRLLAEYLASLQ